MSENKRTVKGERVYSRSQAERLLSSRAVEPEKFASHSNYHVRRKAWVLMGKPLSENVEQQNKFLATLQGMETPKDSDALPGFYALVRQRILQEVPVKEEVSSESEPVVPAIES
jgi:hypothetical protein